MVMYRQSPEIDRLVSKVMSSADPITLHTSRDKPDAEHVLWSVKDPEDLHALQAAFEHIDAMYIADGHHRTSAACRAQGNSRKSPPSGRYLTALVFPDSQLNVLSYNRCLKSLGELDNHTFMHTLTQSFDMQTLSEDAVNVIYAHPDRGIMMYLDNTWYLLTMKAHIQDAYRDNPLGGIDAQVLSDQVMTPMLGLTYPEGEKQVGGVRFYCIVLMHLFIHLHIHTHLHTLYLCTMTYASNTHTYIHHT
ncbi:DUF1015 family protein [archaeon]|nr:MAG: DUF1015 family protein [archaeon]